ncbi:hypothetical protein BDF22DRAFT_734870 [Syncephalis plumigaleata]|nr:hypothetical protein BDF22DRAFT_734870 [Syncephalis plumigaleata]
MEVNGALAERSKALHSSCSLRMKATARKVVKVIVIVFILLYQTMHAIRHVYDAVRLNKVHFVTPIAVIYVVSWMRQIDDVDFHQVCAQLNKENHDLTNGTAAVFRIMAPHSMLQRYASSIKKYGGNSRRIICYIDQQGNDVLRNKASTKCFPEVILKAVPEKLPDSIAQYEQQEDWHIAIVCSVPSIHAAPSKTTMLLPRFLVYYHK